MTLQWEKIHVFISSTFNDMHAERDYLVKSVFPELAEWCEQRKLRLVDIDLRWGVTEQDATQNKNVVKVCLDRIDDCRPFFLCFLGQRRGWVPKISDISEETFNEFPGLQEYAGVDSVTEMEIRHALIEPLHKGIRVEKKPDDRYYKKADHAFFYLREKSYLAQLPGDPPQLREIYTNESIENEAERSLADRQLKHWREVEIRKKSGRPVRDYQASWDPKANSPELLIPLQCPSEDVENITRWQEQWDRVGVKVTGTDVEEDDVQAGKAHHYNQRLTEGRLGDFISKGEPLSQTIIQDLKEAIAARFPDHVEISEETDLQKEIDQQEQFLFVGSEGFIQRGDDFAALDDYVQGESDQLFVLTAPVGLGKSTLLANWVDHYRGEIADDPDQTVHFRFIGQSDRSTNVYSLLQFLLRELKEVHGKFEAEIPDDPQELRKALPELLKEAGSTGKTVIVIDALNQLESGVKDLRWLPYQLPKNVKLIVSFKVGEPPADDLLERMKGRVIHSKVVPFESLDHRKQLVETYLEQYLKQLDERHLQTLINLPAAANPLYLKVVLSELRVFGAFANLGEKIRADFGSTPVSAFEGVLNRLETDPAYTSLNPEEVVPLLFGLLAHARQGLSVEELTTIFLNELDTEKTEQNRKEAADTVYHFLRQVRPFLAQRAGRHDFFFESFRIAALERYAAEKGDEPSPKRVSREWHRPLAAYFDGLPTWFEVEDAENPVPNTRKVAELPYHQAWGELGEELVSTLTNFQFLAAKVLGLGPQLLIDDYDLVKKPSGEEYSVQVNQYKAELDLIQGALKLSAHILAQEPEQIPSQLTGRLLSSEKLLIQQLIRGIQSWDRPWLRPLKPTLTTPGGILLRTISGHTDEIMVVAVTTDGRFAISASRDETIKIWELESGIELTSLPFNSGQVETWAAIEAMAVTNDKRYLVYISSWGRFPEVIDLETGKKKASLKDYRPSGGREILAILPKGQILSSFAEGTLALWDPVSGTMVDRLIPQDHKYPPQMWSIYPDIFSMAISPDGSRAVSSTLEGNLTVWDINQCRELFTVESNHTPHFLTFTADGNQVLAGSENGTINVWDINLRTLQQTVHVGHVKAELTSVAPSFNGMWMLCGFDNGVILNLGLAQARESTLHAHHSGNVQFIICAGGRLAVSFGEDTLMHVWDLERDPKGVPDGHTDKVWDLKLSGEGKLVVSISADNTVGVWDLEGNLLRTMKGHQGKRKFYREPNEGITALATTYGDRYALTGDTNGNLRMWDIESGDCLWSNSDHRRMVTSIAISDDGRRAISSCRGRTLLVWNSENGDKLTSMDDHEGYVHSVAITPDGNRAVSASRDGTLKIWDLGNGSLIHTLTGHSGKVRITDHRVIITPNGKYAISAADGKSMGIAMWDIDQGNEVGDLEESERGALALAVTPDGRNIVSGDIDSVLNVWDLENHRLVHTIQAHSDQLLIPGGNPLYGIAIAITPDGQQVVSVSVDKKLKVWDIFSGEQISSFTVESHLWACAVTMDGETIIAGDFAGQVHFLRLENFTSGTPVVTARRHRAQRLMVRCLLCGGSFEIEQSVLGSAIPCPDCGAALRVNTFTLDVSELRLASRVSISEKIDGRPEKETEPRRLIGHQDSVGAIALTSDGHCLVTGSDDNTLKLWNLQSGEILCTLEGHTNVVNAVALTPDGTRAVSGSDDDTLKLWDLQSGEVLRTLEGHTFSVNAVAVTPDGRCVISGSGDETLKVWDLQNGELLQTLRGHKDSVCAVAVTPDGCRAISGSVGKTLMVWELESGELLRSLEGHTNVVNAVAVTLDGTRAVSASHDKTLKVWDLESGELLRTLEGHTGKVWAVAVTPDGTRAVSGSGDETLKVWDLQKGELLHTLRGHTGGVLTVAVTPDGTRAVSGSIDKTLMVWDLKSGEK